jgi:DNA-binding transcriptional LysR family regulator
MFDDLRGLLVFAHVADARSFSLAATRLGITKSAVSKHVRQLEEHLGVQLLVRTTRKLSLTEVGERVYAASVGVRDSAEIAREAASSHAGVISGTLRVTAPSELGRKYLVPVVTSLLERHPGLSVDLVLTDTFLDLVAERIDVAVRIDALLARGPARVGRALGSGLQGLVARRLAKVRLVPCASPQYLARHGVPRTPSELAALECIHHVPKRGGGKVILRKGRRQVAIELRGRLSCSDGAACVQAAAEGCGVVLAPEFELSAEVHGGRLVPLLTDWQLDELAVHAVFPPRRHVSAKVRAFVDSVAERWRVAPWSCVGA